MIQKIIRVGNSAAVIIPQKLLREIGWKVNDELVVENDPQMKMLYIKEKDSPYKTKITPEFKAWLDDFIKRNRKMLQELAQT